ncbi:uncharacterized protein [Palaemon carinicauda]
MKTWIMLVFLVLLLLFVSAFVGMGSWHMAYEEAKFHGAIREEKTKEAGKTWCNKFVEKVLKEQMEKLKDIQEAHHQKRKIKIGTIGLSVHGSAIVMEAVKDMMKDNLSNYHIDVVSSLQSNRTITDQIQEISKLLDVQVFIGPEKESDLVHLLAWAKTRPHSNPIIVFITPAVITEVHQFDWRDYDNFILIQMRLPSSANLVATSYLISQQNLSVVLMLVNPDDKPSQIQYLKNITGAQVIRIIVEEFTPATQILQFLETSLTNIAANESKVGLLITQYYMFRLLSRISKDSWIFGIPWFTTVEKILYDPYFVDYNFIEHKNFDLSYALFVGNTIKNEKWHRNVSRQVTKSGRNSASETEYISSILEPVFDSVIVATHIGMWFTNENISVEALQGRLSWESSMWAGMSGLLKIDKSLKRDFTPYISLHFKLNISGQFLHYPSGQWKVSNDLSDKTLLF